MKKIISILAVVLMLSACVKKSNTTTSVNSTQTSSVSSHNYIAGILVQQNLMPNNEAIINVNVNGTTTTYTLVSAGAQTVFNQTISLLPNQSFTISVVNGAIQVEFNSGVFNKLINSTINVSGWTGVYPSSITQNY